MSSTLGVTGATTLSSTLAVTGNFNVYGMATTTASTGTINTRGSLMASSTLIADGAATLGSTLAVTGNFNVYGMATTTAASGNFATRGGIMATSTLLIDGQTTLGNASTSVLTVSGGTYLSTASTTGLVKMHTFTAGSGSTVSGLLFGTCAVDPRSTTIGTSSPAASSCAATGVTSSYQVFVTPPSDWVSLDNWLVFEGASASTTAGFIEITLFNASTTAAIDSPSRTWAWMAIR